MAVDIAPKNASGAALGVVGEIRSARSQPHESLEHAPRIAACLPGAPYFSFDDAGGSLRAHPTRSGFRREIQTSRETLSR